MQAIKCPEIKPHARLARTATQMAILKVIREHGPLTRAEIARILSLNPATVTRNVSELIQKNVVLDGVDPKQRASTSSRKGRPGRLLNFNYKAALVIALDVGGTKMLGAVVDLKGNILRLRRRASSEGLKGLFSLVDELLTISRSNGEEIKVISVGIPGVVRSSEGVVLWAPSLQWRDLPLKQMLEEKTGIATFVENDVNLHALGEYYFGAGKGSRNLVCIFVGTGIGAGIIIDGELYKGANEAAGEIGYIIPDRRFLARRYDDFGCLEYLAAGIGIVRIAQQAVREGKGMAIMELAGGKLENVRVEHVFAAAQAGDAFAQELVTEVAQYLAVAVANVAAIINPEIIVLGGGVMKSGSVLVGLIERMVEGTVPFTPKLAISKLGEEAGLLGAVLLASRVIDGLLVEDKTQMKGAALK